MVVLIAVAAMPDVEASSNSTADTESSPIDNQIVITSKRMQSRGGGEAHVTLKDVDIKQMVAVDTTTMIDVTNMTQSDAVNAIVAAGLAVGRIRYDYSNVVPAGNVMRQEPALETPVERGSEVDLVIAQTEIAIEPYKLPLDVMEGEEPRYVWVEKIVHRPFDAQLSEGEIRNVPIFSIMSDGTHDELAETDYKLLEARAKSIAKNLSVAWGMMDENAHLEIVAADQSGDIAEWHVRGPFAPEYPDASSGNVDELSANQQVHIDVVHNRYRLRIMTVFPLDAISYGSPLKIDQEGSSFSHEPLSTREAADYLTALIEGHYLLFARNSNKAADYEELEISKTREGRIFLGICRQVLRFRESFGRTDIRDALTDMAPGLLERLDRLARSAPRDWRVRASYGALNY